MEKKERANTKKRNKEEINTKKRKKVNRTIKKSHVSAVAIILAVVTVVYCYNYVMKETDFFNISGFKIEGNTVYSKEYLVDKTSAKIGQNIFSIDRKMVEKTLEEEVYVEACTVSYYLPDKLLIKIKERQEKYLIYNQEDTIITDEKGIVLDGNMQTNEMYSIECNCELTYNIGQEIKIEGIESFQRLSELINYTNSLEENNSVEKILINKNNIVDLTTKYGMIIRLELNEEYKYSIEFGMEVQNTRLTEGEVVDQCLLDFTKGENPVFSIKSNTPSE